MKKITILISMLMIMGCSDDSGRSATSTSGNGGSGNVTTNTNSNTSLCEQRGYNCTTTNTGNTGTSTTVNTGDYGDGFTPASYGESSFGGITMAYSATSSSNVIAEGLLDLDSNYGFLDCEIPSGNYEIRTSSQGQVGNSVHHYQNIGVNIGNNITGTLENVVAIQNYQGQWVQDVRLKINRVNNNDCSYLSLYFSMPTINN